MPRIRGSESRRRDREFVRLLARDGSAKAALAGSGLDARRLPALLDDPDYRGVIVALLTGDPALVEAA